MESELNYSVGLLNSGMAVNYGGLAVGCMLFIPLVHKFGRRPIYIFSISLQLASCIWYARMRTAGDLIGSSLISGLGGAISEIIMQITVADIFFVHQHATMNSLFVVFESVGAFLGPVASGFVIVSQGWRWIWWWCVIFIGITLLCVLLFFEESKYIPARIGQESHPLSEEKDVAGAENVENVDSTESETATNRVPINHLIKPKSYRQRMALITATDESIWPHFLQPIATLFMFPAVAYCAVTYATSLCWFAIMTSVQATYLIKPPYNFNATGIGLMNLGPFIGTVIGIPFGGYLCDRLIIRLSKRNGGIYEPEMRLWVALPVAISCPGGILMFGLGLTYVRPPSSYTTWCLETVYNFTTGCALGRSRYGVWSLGLFTSHYQLCHSLIPHGLLSGCKCLLLRQTNPPNLPSNPNCQYQLDNRRCNDRRHLYAEYLVAYCPVRANSLDQRNGRAKCPCDPGRHCLCYLFTSGGVDYMGEEREGGDCGEV